MPAYQARPSCSVDYNYRGGVPSSQKPKRLAASTRRTQWTQIKRAAHVNLSSPPDCACVRVFGSSPLVWLGVIRLSWGFWFGSVRGMVGLRAMLWFWSRSWCRDRWGSWIDWMGFEILFVVWMFEKWENFDKFSS